MIIDETVSPKLRILQSALIKTEDLNLPKLRRSTLEETDAPNDNGQYTSTVESPSATLIEEKLLPRIADYEDILTPRLQVDIKEDTNFSKEPLPRVITKKRGRPKLIKDTTPKVKRGRGRPRGNRGLADIGAPLVLNERPRKVDSYAEIIPLTKSKAVHVQKPLMVDIDRLNTVNNRDKRYRLNTLDVLKHLVKQFEPIPSQNSRIHPQLLQQDFKTHLLDHLNHLSDVHGNIDDVSDEIAKVQKEKDEIRASIFELKKNHNNLGNQLNTLREKYQQKKQEHDEFMKLTDNIINIKKDIELPGAFTHDIIKSIDNSFNNLSKIYNEYGLNSRLKDINEALTKINQDII